MSRVIEITDTLITAPTVPAMTVAYAKKHIKALTGAEDDLILSWIKGATDDLEQQTGRQFITATREARVDIFPLCRGRIELPKPPLQEVLSVTYIASDGTETLFDDAASPATVQYAVTAPQGPYAVRGWIEPLSGIEWPTPRCESGAVRIRYRCGYGDAAADVPAMLTGILGFLIGTYDQMRDVTRQSSSGQPMEYPEWLKTQINEFKHTARASIQMRGVPLWV